ncbi:phage holin family protein [Sphingobium phenoxybenzoativorans]|uniref:phage holin family protein n=1 Tax=Sphingobium phenoxybenzoativorans TaxID=1592790 RepID=UPI001C0D51E0|nr:phage holin family protein [Sphingobium phenoxybenzoativorans]
MTEARETSSTGPFGENGAGTALPHDRPVKEEPLKEVLRRLVDDGRAYADAEINRQKIRAAFIGSGLRTVAILGAVALILLFGTLVTLMIGLVFALAPYLTPLGATFAVSITALLIVAILLYAAKQRLRRLFPDKDRP